ncbi:MAG: TerB family tellurite resistance protein [Cytophagaceae bacterium]
MSLQNIYIAMGSLAYAIAKADGEIQDDEKETIRSLAQKEFELSDVNNEWINTMFTNLKDHDISLEEAYRYALDTLEANRFEYDFDDAMKKKCLRFMEHVAESFDGVSLEERLIINRFKEDIQRF